MATMKYIQSLHAECDWLVQYYDVRKDIACCLRVLGQRLVEKAAEVLWAHTHQFRPEVPHRHITILHCLPDDEQRWHMVSIVSLRNMCDAESKVACSAYVQLCKHKSATRFAARSRCEMASLEKSQLDTLL